ncbi:hypothetical protein [Rhodopirellula sallentina]|uniref:TPR repeat-containing protein n=1 Tax=Rhodopirellula sallentina SM41 TaxID=1263870 RepID=M5UPG3_9BACT|nr:hypothetical protein [Rhodopirellula sallentina]EMI57898.1 hypothetical protein RSSM_00671 [Rhodopirellula sallentina SM41]
MPQFDDFFASAANQFAPELRSAIESSSMPGLADGPFDAALAQQLESANASSLQTQSGQIPAPPLVVSGLWLLAGDLDRSHSISQNEPSAQGSFWHGIMHRREGDYSNAAYWFRRVRSSPVFDSLCEIYPDQYSDPFDFNDSVAAAVRHDNEEAIVSLQQIQWTEWQLLMQECMPS